MEACRCALRFHSSVIARWQVAQLATSRRSSLERTSWPAPDVTFAYMGASYAPTLGTSHLCAGCHQGGGPPGRPKLDTFEGKKLGRAASAASALPVS